MQQYLETLCLEKGKALRLPLHQARLEATLRDLGSTITIDIAQLLSQLPHLPEERTRGRLCYTAEGVIDFSLHPYTPRLVGRLRLVTADSLNYAHKSCDRSAIDHCFAQRGAADEVLIVRQGLLTDTSIANIALYDGQRWLTPARPLLRGTHRQALLEAGQIYEADIAAHHLLRYERLRCFNALLRWGEVEVRLSERTLLP